ncbi:MULTISPECIES: hypothetical protein [Adlercreutzia]|uniref:hypothetical protein n=1 Tax=Adlercreutzia TaxID=447020 RepID=UPI002729E6AF|nr:hypothetical protein [Adlercreutzia caecimuris]
MDEEKLKMLEEDLKETMDTTGMGREEVIEIWESSSMSLVNDPSLSELEREELRRRNSALKTKR